MNPLLASFTVAIASLASALAGLTWACEQRIYALQTTRSSGNYAAPSVSAVGALSPRVAPASQLAMPSSRPSAPKSPSSQLTSEQASAALKTVVSGNNAFALDLYSQLRDREGNLFFSPYSISTALAMTYAGARGQTATEMAKVLHFTLEQERLHAALAALSAKLNPTEQQVYQISVANRLWAQKGYSFLNSFLNLTKDNYGAGLEQVDFAHGAEQARISINSWAEQKTDRKIQNLIPQGLLNSEAKLVLTNAIYFKATWYSQFNPQNTKDQPFSITANQQVKVPMMYQEAALPYADLENLQVIELPYGDIQSDDEPKLSLVILLPKQVDGLTVLEEQLTPENLDKWLASLRNDGQSVEIWLPKFKLASGIELKQVLSKMGMASAFMNGVANFSGMNGKQNLFIFAALHKAFVDLNEKGTEAAAATAVTTGTRGGSMTFRADHPFIFLIRDNQSSSILFLGRVVNPLESPAAVEK